MINRLLIANRGEIACRIIRTCKQLNITAVCVYADSDENAPFVKLADEAYPLHGQTSLETYLDQDKLIKIALEKNINAIHPAYGFLSENAEFAKKVTDAGLRFVGPSSEAIDTMGSKAKAKALSEKEGIPTIPGYHGDKQDIETLTKQAKAIGFPLLIKAAFGGGGKGMRIARDENELEELLLAARRESISSFAREELILEKYLHNPRHVEVQIMRDTFGHCLHFFDRDCSIQRRHQKVLEEAPALELSDRLKKQLQDYSIKLASAIDYHGAGTIEFLVEQDELYFIEMNTRLQVEHPVTEMVTGVDLVHCQLLIASEKALPFNQTDLSVKGHAIEVRLYAEDPENEFLPSIGTITHLALPEEKDGLRIDHNLEEGLTISHQFDPMLAKIICHGPTREKALMKLKDALANTVLLGVKTNIAYLHALTDNLLGLKKLPTTKTLSEQPPVIENKGAEAYTLFAVSKFKVLEANPNPWFSKPSWQTNLNTPFSLNYEINKGDHKTISLTPTNGGFLLKHEQKEYRLTRFKQTKTRISALINDKPITALSYENVIILEGKPYQFSKQSHFQSSSSTDASLNAPMPGTVVAIHVEKSDEVKSGQVLAILEAMKMEHQIKAPNDGLIKNIHYKKGQTVNEGDTLFELEGH